jgi:hypothetical protein
MAARRVSGVVPLAQRLSKALALQTPELRNNAAMMS